MRALWIALAAFGLLTSSEQPANERVQATLDRLATMDADEQQAWLVQLEERAIQAARKTLGPAEAAQREAEIRKMLHQELVTWPVLGELLGDTLRREAALAKPQTVAKTEKVERPKAPRPHTVRKPVVTQPPASDPKASPSSPVQVNVEELAARIAGSNLGLRTLESDLDVKGAWDAARLEPLTERLKILVLRHGDLSMFRQLVPADKRAAVGRLEKPRAAISSLGARIFEARRQAESDDFQGTDAERKAELRRLETLSRQLAELANEK